MTYQSFFKRMVAACAAAGHPFPDWAACEALEESREAAYSSTTVLTLSDLAGAWGNMFGQKYPSQPPLGFNYAKVQLASWEIVNGLKVLTVGENADWWPAFLDWETSARERIAHLRALPIPHYLAALRAPDGPTFVGLMGGCKDPGDCRYTGKACETWATDPQRAANVAQLYQVWQPDMQGDVRRP